KTEVGFGTGLTQAFTYDAAQRLSSVVGQNIAAGMTGGGLQNLQLSYDAVGNITGLSNTPSSPQSGVIPALSMAFGYDDLHRLRTMGGSATLADQTMTTLGASYDFDDCPQPSGAPCGLHRLTHKSQTMGSMSTSTDPALRNLTMTYDAAHPHRLAT